MTPAARIKAALDLLERINSSRVPMDSTTGDYMRFRKYIGSKDRAAIVERVYASMRAHARLGWWLSHLNAADTARGRMIVWLTLGEGRTAKDIKDLFDGSQYGAAPLTEEEMRLAEALKEEKLDSEKVPEAIRVECPPAHEAALRAYFGKDFMAEMAAFLHNAPLDLRVNIRTNTREEAAQSLKNDGVETEPTPYCPWGLRAKTKAFLSQTKAFTKGRVEIQDEGSQLIAYLCHAQPGQQVLDYCAGAGGKTLALAAAMNNKGRIVAMDIEGNRLERARPRFRRAGVHDIIEVRPLSDEKNRKWLRRQKETFDVALADVPCSGTGTWRRNPDMRWRAYGPSLDELLAVQAEILDKIAKTVKLGGRLVYATCSLLPAENETQIENFLARSPEFAVLPLPQAWPSAPQPGEGPYMRLTPHRFDTDGFFAAVLVRKG